MERSRSAGQDEGSEEGGWRGRKKEGGRNDTKRAQGAETEGEGRRRGFRWCANLKNNRNNNNTPKGRQHISSSKPHYEKTGMMTHSLPSSLLPRLAEISFFLLSGQLLNSEAHVGIPMRHLQMTEKEERS